VATKVSNPTPLRINILGLKMAQSSTTNIYPANLEVEHAASKLGKEFTLA